MKFNITRMSFMEELSCLFGPKRNEESMTEILMPQITEMIEQYRRKRKEHVDRMVFDMTPPPSRTLKITSEGKGGLRKTLKR
jgi:hypothetical protein